MRVALIWRKCSGVYEDSDGDGGGDSVDDDSDSADDDVSSRLLCSSEPACS